MTYEELFVIEEWPFNYLIELASRVIEVLAVFIIFIFVVVSTYQFISRIIKTKSVSDINISTYKDNIGKSLLLALDILIAADVIRTVALEPTMEKIIVLGLLVLIRTFLSWSISVEMDGTWPWKKTKSN